MKNIRLIYHLCYSFCPHDEYGGQGCYGGMQRAPNQFRCWNAPYKGLHGWPYHHINPREQVNLTRTQETHLMGKDEFQALRVKIHGTEEGKGVDKFHFPVSGIAIPSITENPVRNSSLNNSATIQTLSEELVAWLTKMDKSGLPGRFKAWICQHSILTPNLVASACLCSPNNNCGIPQKEYQWLSSKAAKEMFCSYHNK